jgi:hypothetical protein
MMFGLIAILALAVDVGYICAMRAELQRTADASAMAAAWELLDAEATMAEADPRQTRRRARACARTFAALNKVGSQSPSLGRGDIVIGHRSNIFDVNEPILRGTSDTQNTVRVRVRRTNSRNGEIPLFFARVLGFDSAALAAEATAAFWTDLQGFSTPSGNGNQPILPIALDEETWSALLDGDAGDDWTWDYTTKEVRREPDGILECNLYPQDTGSPGNRGTVDIGSNNNSTADLSRQIVDGVSSEDIEYHGGALEFDVNGCLYLNGDPGISAGIKDELTSIIGKPRVIPIFREVEGNGNNAMYTIVAWVGVRLLEVELTGSMSSKRVIVQPCYVSVRGGIPSSDGTTSYSIGSPVVLVQ